MLEKNKRRALRRHHMFRIQRKRFLKVRRNFAGWLEDSYTEYEKSVWQGIKRPLDVGFFERLRWGHFGCGCMACKPWKHCRGIKMDYKVSERRQLQNDRY